MKQIALHVGPDVGLCVSLVREDLTCRVLCRPMCIRCRVLCQYGALHVGSYVGLCVSYVGSFVKWSEPKSAYVGSYVGMSLKDGCLGLSPPGRFQQWF